MAHDVFISHSAKDKATADAVCAMLESEGIRCWIAPRDVLASMEWGEAIIDAIEQCRIMVLVFTANANASPQIRREIERAVNHGVAILPLRMEDVLPVKSLEYFIGNVHWLDALTPPLEAHLKNLAGTIKIVLARMEPREASPVQPAAAREVPEVVMPPEPAKAPPAVSTFSQAGASPNVESPFEPPLRQEPTAVDPVARAAAGDASETQHPAEVTDEPRVSTEESFRGVSRERPSIASWSREERGREGHSQASVGKLYLFGLLMLSACLIALGITWLTTPLGSSTFEGLSEQHRFFYFYFFKAAGAGLIVAGLGIAAIQKTRLPGAALAAILLSCSVLCTGLFFAGEIKNGWIWFVLDDSVGDFRKLALVGGALLIVGLELRRRGTANRWVAVGTYVFGAGLLLYLAGRTWYSGAFIHDFAPNPALWEGRDYFQAMWWGTWIAYVLSPAAVVACVCIMYRPWTRIAAICLAVMNLAFVPLLCLLWWGRLSEGESLAMLLTWLQGVGLAGGALVLGARPPTTPGTSLPA